MTGLKQSATYLVLFSSYLLLSCSVQQQISRSAKETVLQQPAFKAAHVGISIYEPATGKYWFNYQGDKYFVPASNTKIPTCYAAMKYLGDSLVGLKYDMENGEWIMQGTGDPTFLNREFINQPVFDFLKLASLHSPIRFSTRNWDEKEFGSGWSWNDYNESYMAERSPLPVFGNIVRIRLVGEPVLGKYNLLFQPSFFEKENKNLGIQLINSPSRHIKYADSIPALFSVKRNKILNQFELIKSPSIFSIQEIPFITDTISTALEILKEDYKLNIQHLKHGYSSENRNQYSATLPLIIHSQPTDSMLKPMMHRSDNFFAEQSLLMVSNELLGVMNDEKIIDTLLKTDFKDLPQKPRWADGSGLSRYNLFTPQDMVAILNKMKNEFGVERIKVIFPTGGEGTISNYYKQDAGFIYGKTGTLSGVVAFSGFLYTKKGRLLIFSTLVNNHNESATDVRRAIEKFLIGVRNTY